MFSKAIHRLGYSLYATSQSASSVTTTFQQRNYFWDGFFRKKTFPHIQSEAGQAASPLLIEVEEALEKKRPSIWHPEKKDYQSIAVKTVQATLHPKTFLRYQALAKYNLDHWSTTRAPSPEQVEVLYGDWGKITLQVTQKYGTAYAVLNMANAYFVGGDFIGGGSAQEENMFIRTTCCHYLEEASEGKDEEDKDWYANKKHGVPMYSKNTTQLIEAKTPMTAEELDRLSITCGKPIVQAYKILLTNEPEVCFRGEQLFEYIDGERIALDTSCGSFRYLRDDEIFPFQEMRSAALDLTDTSLPIPVNWEDPVFLHWFRTETKRRIDAQLDTALLYGIKHIILSAFGCGAFKNKAEEVAKIYRESIAERAEYFEHIVFAIYNPHYGPDNFPAFENELHGMKLGATVEQQYSSRLQM